MEHVAATKAATLLERAKKYHATGVVLPDDTYIVGSNSRPDCWLKYQAKSEPVVDANDLYPIGNAKLTVNDYNALVLNSSNLLIADIDLGDVRLNWHAGAVNHEEVEANLHDLKLLDQHTNGDIQFAKQSYSIYRTHSGCRVICTSVEVPWDEYGWLATQFLRFLRSDPNYIRLCGEQRCYRARLTPKPWRDSGCGDCVCVRLAAGKVVSQAIAPQLQLHDELTLPRNDWSSLA